MNKNLSQHFYSHMFANTMILKNAHIIFITYCTYFLFIQFTNTDYNEFLCGISITHGFGLVYKLDAAKNEIIQSDLDFQWNFGEIQTQSSLIQDPECVFKNDKI